MQELDLNPTARSSGQGWSSSCVEMPGRGGADSIAKAVEEVEDRVPALPDTMCECDTPDERMEEAEKASSSQ